MGSTISSPRRAQQPILLVDRDNVLPVPALDASFAASVDAAVAAIPPDETDLARAVEEILRRRYPRATLVARDPLARFGAETVWYALRDGRGGHVPLRRILVVDDDPTVADVMTAALEPSRFDVRSAPDGAVALALVAEWPPNLVLLDLTMPRMSGEEFAQRYRELPPPRAPIVVVSAAQDAPSRALRIEARSVVPKPFDLDMLAKLIDTYA